MKKQEVLRYFIDNSNKNHVLKFNMYDKLNKVYGGIVNGRLYCITASTGVGKTTFLKNILIDLILNNKDKQVYILYYALEESKEAFFCSIVSILAMYLDREYINARELLGIEKISQRTINYLESSFVIEKGLEIMNHIYVYEDFYDPKQIKTSIDDFLIQKKFMYVADDFSTIIDIPSNTVILPVIDHVNLLNATRSSIKDCIDYMTEEIMHKYVNKKLNMPAIVVHQQGLESEGLEAIKRRGGKPSISNLGDSRTPSRTYHYIMGLYDPKRFGHKTYKNIDITDQILVCLPLKVRDGYPYEVIFKFDNNSRFLIQI